jgi:RNA polymerase sigma-70 factor (ECF subfamily)
MLVDESVIRALQNGSNEAARKFFKAYTAYIYGAIYKYLSWHEEVEDVFQDIMLTIARDIRKLDKLEAIDGWIWRLSINRTIDYLRKKRLRDVPTVRNQEVVQNIKGEKQDPAERIENRQFMQMLQDALSRLSPQKSKVFILCNIEEKSIKEAADILQISEGTVKSRLHFARQELKEWLTKQGYG